MPELTAEVVDQSYIAAEVDRMFTENRWIRETYEGITHPDKERVLYALAALQPNMPQPDPDDEDAQWSYEWKLEQRLGSKEAMVFSGLLYFQCAGEQLVKKRAKQQIEDEVDARTDLWYEDREMLKRQRIKGMPKQYDISDLDSKDITKEMLAIQVDDAFGQHYNSHRRFMVIGLHDLRPEQYIAAGMVVAKQVAGLELQEAFSAMTSYMYGNEEYTSGALKDILEAQELLSWFTVPQDQFPGYGFTPQEAGYGLFRSRRSAAHYILCAAKMFWGKKVYDLYYGDDEDWDEKPKDQTPIFNEEDVILTARGHSGVHDVVKRRALFPELTPELFVKVLLANDPEEYKERRHQEEVRFLDRDDSLYCDFNTIAEAFKLDQVTDSSQFVGRLIESGWMDVVWAYYAKFKNDLYIPSLEIFRDNITLDAHEFTEAILSGELTEEHHALGVTEPGKRGIEQLRAVITSVQRFILSQDKTAEGYRTEIERIANSKIYERIWRAAVRFDQATFGSTGTNEISRILRIHANEHQEHELEPLDSSVYWPSETYEVRESVKVSESEVGRDVVIAIEHIASLVNLAYRQDLEEVFHTEVRTTEEHLRRVADTLRTRIESEPSTKKHNKLQEQLAIHERALEGFSETLLKGTFVEAYQKLGAVKSARGILRHKALHAMRYSDMSGPFKLAFGDSLRKRGDDTTGYLAGVVDAVDHVLVQEFLLKQEGADEAFEYFVTNKLFNTSIIEDALKKVQTSSAGGPTRSFQFVPSRDVGLELSGQIGDACWASVYSSVAEDMPQLTGVLIAETLGDGSQKLVGSGLFIEATSGSGERLLIIRGLNPIQNTVTQLDNDDFLAKYVEYAHETAKRAGRKLAIVKDHRGGASTNRPTLFNAIERLVDGTTPVEVPASQVTFNSYTLEGSIYILD